MNTKQSAFSTMRSLHIIGHQIDVVFDRLLQSEFDLTLSRFRILLPLIELGPSTQSEVARFNLVTEASIARQVRLLDEAGYLKLVPCKTDARKCYLTLTKKTEQLVPHITKRLSEEITHMYSDFSPSEFTTLATLLNRLLTLGTSAVKDVTCTG
jgi:DNA-binding MarR family transcriptional regulator